MMIMYAEVRRDGKWQKVGSVFDSYFKEIALTDRVCDQPNSILSMVFGLPCESSSNRRVFGIIPPAKDGSIDMSDKVAQSRYFTGDKVVCALTLKEILDYDWQQDIKEIGYITEWQYRWSKRENKNAVMRKYPHQGYNVVAPEEMEMILKNENLRNGKKYSVKIERAECKVCNVCEFFCEHSIPKLKELVPEGGNYEDIRVIYTFAT